MVNKTNFDSMETNLELNALRYLPRSLSNQSAILKMGSTLYCLFWTVTLHYIQESNSMYLRNVYDTLHQWRTQVRFEIPAEIPFAHELSMKMIQENMKIKKIYWGNLL